MSSPHRLAALIGAALFGLAGALFISPAGLSGITVEILADNAWSPTMFTAVWAEGDWQQRVPLTLPVTTATPVTLELIAEPDAPGEVWLLNAAQPDGKTILLDEFKSDGGWELRKIDRDPYRGQYAWVSSPGGGAATLRWAGEAAGPLTLLFLQHQFSGKVTVRWAGQEKELDLQNPTIAFKGVTLPLDDPPVWRAGLPLSALLTDRVGFVAQADPGGNLPVVIKQINVTGLPGGNLQLSGRRLLDLLRVKYGAVTVTAAGIQFVPNTPGTPPKFALDIPVVNASGWGRLIPWLENSLVILYLLAVGGVLAGGAALLLPPGRASNLNVVVVAVIITLLLGEIGLQIF